MNIYYHKTKYGKSPADGYIEEYVRNAMFSGDDIKTSSELVVGCVRLNIIRGNIDYKDVTIYFEQDGQGPQLLRINEFAALSVWPKEFCNLSYTFAYEIIMGAVKMRKERNNKNVKA